MCHDLTDVGIPFFRYQVRPSGVAAESVSTIVVEVDTQKALMAMRSKLPKLFQPFERTDVNTTVSAGESAYTGLQEFARCLRDGITLPSSLPPYDVVVSTFKAALKVPERCGEDQVWAVVNVFMTKHLASLDDLKKKQPTSQSSSEPTPA
jgi:hypothetical protein